MNRVLDILAGMTEVLIFLAGAAALIVAARIVL